MQLNKDGDNNNNNNNSASIRTSLALYRKPLW